MLVQVLGGWFQIAGCWSPLCKSAGICKYLHITSQFFLEASFTLISHILLYFVYRLLDAIWYNRLKIVLRLELVYNWQDFKYQLWFSHLENINCQKPF